MHIVEKLRSGLREALKEELPELEVPNFAVEVPRERDHGDFATNLAMMLAKPARNAPRKIADILVNNLKVDRNLVEKVEIAGPGFINFYLDRNWPLQGLPAIFEEDVNYGRVNLGAGKKVQVEFVSANPTGLLHMGNARGAALGDSLAGILDFAGHDVSREYYINDAGKQIENFGLSLEARYFQLLGREGDVPEGGYHGQDIIDTVKNFIEKYGDQYLDIAAEERRQAARLRSGI